MTIGRKVILYIAMSVDGYIATATGDLSFLDSVQKENEDYGYHRFIETIDTVILGRKTYEKVLDMGYDFPHADKESYIITRTPRPAIGNINFHTGDLSDLVSKLKSKEGKNIFIDGGAEIVNILMKNDLIDEYIISVIPVFLGSGIRLFNDGRPESCLRLVSSVSFEKGLVQSHYSVTRNDL